MRVWPGDPAARYEQREAVELAFVAACQHLPGNQRAALLLFEVLGFSVAEIALREIGDARTREAVADFSAALEHGDADALVALVTKDVTWSMPPLPHW
jgi:RNA polymerase sigma-70 factor (ECF subfamily)